MTPLAPRGKPRFPSPAACRRRQPNSKRRLESRIGRQCAPTKTAYIEPVAVGERLPEMPLFLHDEWHVPAPLEEAYQTAWGVMPPPIKRLFDGP